MSSSTAPGTPEIVSPDPRNSDGTLRVENLHTPPWGNGGGREALSGIRLFGPSEERAGQEAGRLLPDRYRHDQSACGSSKTMLTAARIGPQCTRTRFRRGPRFEVPSASNDAGAKAPPGRCAGTTPLEICPPLTTQTRARAAPSPQPPAGSPSPGPRGSLRSSDHKAQRRFSAFYGPPRLDRGRGLSPTGAYGTQRRERVPGKQKVPTFQELWRTSSGTSTRRAISAVRLRRSGP
jgi:hypothetical protein